MQISLETLLHNVISYAIYDKFTFAKDMYTIRRDIIDDIMTIFFNVIIDFNVNNFILKMSILFMKWMSIDNNLF